MSGPLGSSQWMYASGFYNGVTSSSLRANHGDSPGLLRTMVTGTSRRIFTWSGWIKRTGIQTNTETFMQVNPNNNDTGATMFGFRDKDDTDGPNIQFTHYNGSSYDFRIETTAKLRDVSSWYHILLRVDTTQGTNSNRIRIYINGDLQTSLAQNTYPSENFDTNYNVNSSKMYVAGGAAANAGGGNVYFDSYITEINYVDGLSLGPDSFGETKNGVWIPINPVVSDYGNNGFRLQFLNSGTGTTGQGTTATTNIGDDSSGNGHNFSVLNYVTSDVVLDHPENNWCTINSVREDTLVNGSVTLSEGNLQSVDAGTTYSLHWTSTFEMSSGKWYWEVLAHTLGGDYANIGVCNAIHRGTTVGTGVFYGNDGKRNAASNTGGNTSYGATYADDDIIGVAFDADNESVTFYKNNSSQGAVGSVLTQANGGYFAGVGDGQNSTTYKYVANFGQDSSFAGNKTAQGNTDGNGNGDFYYAPPSGFVALCSANLPDLTIGPDSATQADDYHNTVLWDGNGDANAITGVGFKPDWLWSKDLTGTENHIFLDSSRGLTHRLSSNNDDGETTDSNAVISSFDTDGFTLTQYHDSNQNSSRNVGWCWKANGGVATASGSESGDNPAHSVQANPTAGFSIVTFTGTQAVGTVPHGLGAVPKMIILKNREVDGNGWIVYHEHVDQTDFVFLNNTNLRADNANRFNDTKPTSTVFTLGADANINDDGVGIVAYVFADVEGYSKFGHYDANGNANGTVVFTGFRPAFVMLKNIDNNTNGGNWVMMDDTRLGDDIGAIPPILSQIKANSSDAEFDSGSYPLADFLANGFKLRSGGTGSGIARNVNNANGNDYIYMAFAHSPFKYANAF